MADGVQVIEAATSTDNSILVVSRGDRGISGNVLRYACWPRRIESISPGAPAFDGDIWSIDLSPAELMDEFRSYDYVYFYQLDEPFREAFGEMMKDNGYSEAQIFSID